MNRRGFFALVGAAVAVELTKCLGLPPIQPSFFPFEPGRIYPSSPYDSGIRNWKVVKYDMGFEVSHELVDDDLYGVLKEGNLRYAMRRNYERLARS